jgi:hypothetical protein
LFSSFRFDTALLILIVLDMTANHRADGSQCVHVAAEGMAG